MDMETSKSDQAVDQGDSIDGSSSPLNWDRILAAVGALTGVLSLTVSLWTFQQAKSSRFTMYTAYDSTGQTTIIQSFADSSYFRVKLQLFASNIGQQAASIVDYKVWGDGGDLRILDSAGNRLSLPVTIDSGESFLFIVDLPVPLSDEQLKKLERPGVLVVDTSEGEEAVTFADLELDLTKPMKVGQIDFFLPSSAFGTPSWIPGFTVELVMADKVVTANVKEGRVVRVNETRRRDA